jgi:hypothetical protein
MNKKVTFLLLCIVCLFGYAFESKGQVLERPIKIFDYQICESTQINYLREINNYEINKTKNAKPPLDQSRVIREIALGTLGSWIAAIFLASTTDDLPNWLSNSLVFSGIVLGSSAGVYIIGDTDTETGSFLATAIGSSIGTIVITSLVVYMQKTTVHSSEGNINILFLACLGSPLPSVFGSIGFNMTRKYRFYPTPETALINFRDGRISLAFPKISFYRDRSNKEFLTPKISLINASF